MSGESGDDSGGESRGDSAWFWWTCDVPRTVSVQVQKTPGFRNTAGRSDEVSVCVIP